MSPTKRAFAITITWSSLIGSAADAQWTVTDLNPSWATDSQVRGVDGGQQVGLAEAFVVTPFRASLWSGTSASYVDLSPAGATDSIVYAIHAGQQAGEAEIGEMEHASLWTGTAASWIDLNPPGVARSSAYGVHSGQ